MKGFLKERWSGIEAALSRFISGAFSRAANPTLTTNELYPLQGVTIWRKATTHSNKGVILNGVSEHVAETLKGRIPLYQMSHIPDGIIFTPVMKDIVFTDSVDPDFIGAARFGMSRIPPFARQLLAEAGTSFAGARLMTDFHRDYAHTPCRGQAGFLVNTTGMYSEFKNRAHVTQGRLKLMTDIFQDYSDDAPGTVLHEAGHALWNILMYDINMYEDNGVPKEQHITDFIDAYHKDVEALNGATDWKGYCLKYYLQESDGGTQDDEDAAMNEVFCEMFSEKCLDFKCEMQSAFPATSKVLDKILISAAVLIQNNPDLGCFIMMRPQPSTPDRAPGGRG